MMSHSFDRVKIPAGFWMGLRQLNIAAHDVVRKAGMPLTIINEPVVTTAQYFALWQALSEIVGDPAAGIVKLMTDFETAQLPPSVLAPYHARDYRDAVHRMARYKQLCSPERFHITEEGDLCFINLEWLYKEQPEPPMLLGVREQAQEHLSDPSLDLKEVAFLLGYEDQNSFFRAFRLWEGDTPSNWRAEHLGSNAITKRRLDIPPIH